MTSQKKIVISIQLSAVALLILGAEAADHTGNKFYWNYFADIALPIAFYYLLILVEGQFTFLEAWYAKAAAIFSLAALAEGLQYLEVYALGRIYDPYDFVAYAFGAVLAVAVDAWVLSPRISGLHSESDDD